MATKKIYNLGKSTKMTVSYDASNLSALIKCDHPLVMDGLIFRQEVLSKKMIENGSSSEEIPKFSYGEEGSLTIYFNNIEGLVKFSNWLLTDQALKQIKTAILEIKMIEGLKDNESAVEDLIDELYGI